MITEETQSKFNNLIEKLNTVKEEYKLEAGKLLHELIQEYLESTPEYVVGLKWQQYTPYFNDGDSCDFTIYFDSYDYENLLFKFEDSTEIEQYYHLSNEVFIAKAKEYLEKSKGLLRSLATFIHNNSSILEELLGDHVEVTVMKGSKTAIIDEYVDHN